MGGWIGPGSGQVYEKWDTMAEFNAEDILRRLRGETTQGVPASAVRASVVAAPPSSSAAAAAASATGPASGVRPLAAPRAPLAAGYSPALVMQTPLANSDRPTHMSAVQIAPSEPLSGPVSPLHRKERLDVREALERENAQLRAELKKANDEVKSLKSYNETISNEFRSYKTSKEGLLAQKLGIIAQLSEKLAALTGEKAPKYSNNRPLSQPSPFRPMPSTSQWLDKPASSRKQQRLNEEMREKLEAAGASGSAGFGKPTWSEIMRRVTPHEQDFTRSFRSSSPRHQHSNGTGSSNSAPASASALVSASASSASLAAHHGERAYASSTPNTSLRAPTASHEHGNLSSSNGAHDHHSYAAFNLSASASSRGHNIFKDRRPGESEVDDDGPVIEIDLSTRL